MKPKKKGRKLFTPQYVTDDEEEEDIDEPKSNRKKPTQNTNVVLDIEIPQFTNTKLFDSKRFGSPSVRKMAEICTPPQKFKTPAIPATLPSMKHRSGKTNKQTLNSILIEISFLLLFQNQMVWAVHHEHFKRMDF